MKTALAAEVEVETNWAEEAITLNSNNSNINEVDNDAVEAITDEVTTNPAVAKTDIHVNDEMCNDEEYHENYGKTAFRCMECKMVYIPGTFMHGNEIVDYNLCKQHLGVIKCEVCRMDLIGFDRIRVHRESFHVPSW